MAYRTTILLDEQSRTAARQLAVRFDCSTSEAIRRAILSCRDLALGIPPTVRQQRTQALLEWIELSKGMDPEAEIRRLKSEDEGF